MHYLYSTKVRTVFLCAGFIFLVFLALLFGSGVLGGKGSAAEYIRALEEEYRSDTYGGATPEETIALFAEAIRRSDIVRASSYFVPDERAAYLQKLSDAEREGLLPELVRRLEGISIKYPLVEGDENTFIFESFDESGALTLQIYLARITNGTWKIVSM